MAAVSPLRATARTEDGATPMAHPEHSGWQTETHGDEGVGSVAAGVRARGRIATGATTPAVSVLSTSSFSPPQPLVLLAVRPLGRVSRSACVFAGTAGLKFKCWVGPTSVAVRFLVLPGQPCPRSPCTLGNQSRQFRVCPPSRRVVAPVLGCCVAAAGCGGRQRSESSAAGQLPSTSRSHPTSAEAAAATASRAPQRRGRSQCGRSKRCASAKQSARAFSLLCFRRMYTPISLHFPG